MITDSPLILNTSWIAGETAVIPFASHDATLKAIDDAYLAWETAYLAGRKETARVLSDEHGRLQDAYEAALQAKAATWRKSVISVENAPQGDSSAIAAHEDTRIKFRNTDGLIEEDEVGEIEYDNDDLWFLPTASKRLQASNEAIVTQADLKPVSAHESDSGRKAGVIDSYTVSRDYGYIFHEGETLKFTRASVLGGGVMGSLIKGQTVTFAQGVGLNATNIVIPGNESSETAYAYLVRRKSDAKKTEDAAKEKESARKAILAAQRANRQPVTNSILDTGLTGEIMRHNQIAAFKRGAS